MVAIAEETSAKKYLEKLFAGTKINGTSGDAEHTMNPVVTDITVNIPVPSELMAHPRPEAEILAFHLSDEGNATALRHHPLLAGESLLQKLKDVPELTKHVQLEPEADHVMAMKAKLEELIGKGADLPPELLKWKGFDPATSESLMGLQDHAVTAYKAPGAISAFIAVPVQNPDNDSLSETVRSNIAARLPEIKDTLVKRLVKYQHATDDAQRDAIRQKVDALDIAVVNDHSAVNLVIRSPEQKANIDPVKFETLAEDEKAKIEATNVLSGLSQEQLGKLLGRAVLNTGETAKEIFPIIAGRKDMQTAIAKSLHRLKSTKPELAAEIDQFMNDDMFKEHNNWRSKPKEAGALKTKPRIVKEDGKPLQIQFELPKGVADSVIHALYERQKQLEAVPAAAQVPAEPAAVVPESTQLGAALSPAEQRERAVALKTIDAVLSKNAGQQAISA